jgi:uncharacterized protein YdaU (DUF1376 family)
MNYYEHHLGDWAKDTVHLTMLEEGAYRRLVDVYYVKEKPLPKAIRDIYKLARAGARPEREAVDAVLREFFQERDDGWHHKRCDEELARYAEGQEEVIGKRENDKERQRRARERRKQLFEHLRGHGIVPAWDTKTSDLEAQLSRVTGGAESQTGHTDTGTGHANVTQPVTRDNTAIHTPDTNPQTPVNEDRQLASVTGDVPPVTNPAGLPTCPIEQIVAAYHEILPELPRARLLGDDRRKAVRALWRFALTEPRSDGKPRATNADEALIWVRSYFERARENDFLMGRTPRVNGHAGWECDLDFLLSKKGMKHVIEKTKEQQH